MKHTGTITVPLPPHEARALFTPEGERAWVPHWDPCHHSDTVFTTAETTWVILDAPPDTVRYARLTPGRHAGTVEVACRAHGAGTEATVTYDLTPLAPDTTEHLERGFDAMLADWERSIADACSR